jgi:hypothetical protein
VKPDVGLDAVLGGVTSRALLHAIKQSAQTAKHYLIRSLRRQSGGVRLNHPAHLD